MSKIGVVLLGLSAFFSLTCSESVQVNTLETKTDFNKNWQFVKDADTTISESLFDKMSDAYSWDNVRLPHTANIEPLVISDQQWQGG